MHRNKSFNYSFGFIVLLLALAATIVLLGMSESAGGRRAGILVGVLVVAAVTRGAVAAARPRAAPAARGAAVGVALVGPADGGVAVVGDGGVVHFGRIGVSARDKETGCVY